MNICVTGHRPPKLYGYDIRNEKWNKLKDLIKQILIDKKCDKAISGMALGTDQVFALSVIELKEAGYNIKLHCAIPCTNYSTKWNKESVKLYDAILAKADEYKIVTNSTYKPWVMQKRNEYMVDNSDVVIAVCDGSPSGTLNCIKYAEKQGKEIIRINPETICVEKMRR